MVVGMGRRVGATEGELAGGVWLGLLEGTAVGGGDRLGTEPDGQGVADAADGWPALGEGSTALADGDTKAPSSGRLEAAGVTPGGTGAETHPASTNTSVERASR